MFALALVTVAPASKLNSKLHDSDRKYAGMSGAVGQDPLAYSSDVPRLGANIVDRPLAYKLLLHVNPNVTSSHGGPG